MIKTIIIAGLIAITAITGALYIAQARAAAVNSTAQCIHDTAEAEGYAGNPYSKEAWQLFAGDCRE